VQVKDDVLSLVIEDNGCGFERAPETATEDGLRNMSQRVEDIGGRCDIQSSPGAGTKVNVELPWCTEKNQ
jgi:signal transduction histidine kinase